MREDRVGFGWSCKGFMNLRALVESSAFVSLNLGGWNGDPIVEDMIDWVSMKLAFVGES